MRSQIWMIAILGLILGGSSARASIIIVEPDDFAAGTNISNAFPGVTLSAQGTGFGNGPSIFSVASATQPNEPFTASTGTRVFGTDNGTFPHLFREPGFLNLLAVFATPTNFVSIDFISNDAADTGRLEAFDSSNVSLGVLFTGSLSANQVQTLTFISPTSNIASIRAGGDSGASSIGLDNLQFATPDAVPEPTSMAALGLMGVAGFGYIRRRWKGAPVA